MASVTRMATTTFPITTRKRRWWLSSAGTWKTSDSASRVTGTRVDCSVSNYFLREESMSRLQKVSLTLRQRIRCWVLSILWFLLGTVQATQSKILKRITSGSTPSRTSSFVLTTMMRVEERLMQWLKSLELKPRYLKDAQVLKTPVSTRKRTRKKTS